MEIDYNKQSKQLTTFLLSIYSVMNNLEEAYGGEGVMLKALGIVKTTFLSLIDRILRNVDGLIVVMEHPDNFLERNRQPIMLLIRGITEDALIGAYLMRLKDDPKSFQNELMVISSEFVKFSEFLIQREPLNQFASAQYRDLPKQEIEKIIDEKMNEFRERNSEYYKKDSNGKLIRKKAKDLRMNSDPRHLYLKSPDGNEVDWNHREYKISFLDEIIEFVKSEENSPLQLYTYTYMLYRVLSQYQHFSLDVTIQKLNKEPEFEITLIKKCMVSVFLLLEKQLTVLGISSERLADLDKALHKYIQQ